MLRNNFNPAVQDGASPCPEELTNAPFVRLTIPLRNNGFCQSPSQRFLAGPSENRRGLRVPIGHNPGRVDRDHPIERGIDDGPVSLLALEQRRLGGFRPGTFLLRLSMFGAQSCRRPEQQHQHGNPDHSGNDPGFPHERMNRR